MDKALGVDKNAVNEKFAYFCSLVDWRQAFDRQCPTMGVKAFVNNGVRNSLAPILVSYFQNRKMVVKWHGCESSTRDLVGGGPQGSLWGILEYLAQSNSNTDFVAENMKYKFIDDLSILEKINLLSIGLTSYNFKNHVASDLPVDKLFLPGQNLKTQDYLNKIVSWTEDNKMLLNKKKSKGMIFNFTRDYQFSTNVYLDDECLEIIDETRLLGVIVSDDLSWDKNTLSLVRRANARMRILHKLVDYGVPISDLVLIYFLYIRSVLEQSCPVWHSALTVENSQDLERVQKTALKIILQDDYINYEDSLDKLGLDSLSVRREKLCIRFAKSSVQNPSTSDMFPLNPNATNVTTRKREKFYVLPANTERLKKSSIPYMRRLPNEHY